MRLIVKIASVVGARPNFVKLAPIHRAISKSSEHTIIHTGQHYEYELSEIFFKEFNIPAPNFNLEVNSGTQAYQVGEMLKKLQDIFLKNKFDLVIVYGDTNSTFAGAFSAKTTGMKVAHVEAGLRSFDRGMPEEVNRILTDHSSDLLFAPTQTAMNNLQREGISEGIVHSGDLSVEIIKQSLEFTRNSSILRKLKIRSKSYNLFTMHRAENTRLKSTMTSVIKALGLLSEYPIIFPMHPRTKKILNELKLYSKLLSYDHVILIKPVGYIDFIKLLSNANKIISDSGGIQKEAYLLGVPCITIRRNTEWIETVSSGWNVLVGTDKAQIVKFVRTWNPQFKKRKSIFGCGDASLIIKNSIFSLERD